MYGEHLLTENTGKPAAIVEAPATAIVASIYLSAFVWLAAGSLSYLTTERCQALAGRADGRAFILWSNKARELAGIASVTVSNLLERCATATERDRGLDLRDYLTRLDYREFQPAPPPQDKYTLTIDGQEHEINAIAVIMEIDNCKIVTYMLRNAVDCLLSPLKNC